MNNQFYILLESFFKNGSNQKFNINPTEIYNEGWMCRLLTYYSIQNELILNENIKFKKEWNWCSEAHIKSPFEPRIKGDTSGEGKTHADMALGDFDINYTRNGELYVKDNPEQFGIIEAKMNSGLSKGTRRVKDYNQAIRNIACIANSTNENTKTFFYVAMPKESKHIHEVKEFLDWGKNEVILRDRIDHFIKHGNNPNKIDWDNLINKASKVKTGIIFYHEWISKINENEINNELSEFLKECVFWNNVGGNKLVSKD